MLKTGKILPFILVACSLIGCATSGTNFNWNQVEQLEIGMTFEEVKTIMGEPMSTTAQKTDEGVREIWVWSWAKANFLGTVEGKTASVVFMDGVATEVPAVPSEAKIEEENPKPENSNTSHY